MNEVNSLGTPLPRNTHTSFLNRLAHLFPINIPEPERDETVNQKKRNRNYKLAMIHMFTVSFLIQVVIGPPLQTYMFLTLNQKNSWIGIFDGISGVISMIYVFPMSYIIGKYNLEFISKVTGLLFLLSLFLGYYALVITTAQTLFFYLIILNLADQSTLSVSLAVFTQSMIQSEYKLGFLRRGLINVLANIIAPLISLAFFLIYGNEWELSILRILLISGLVTTCTAAAITHFLYKNVNLSLIRDQSTSPLLEHHEKPNLNYEDDKSDEVPSETTEIQPLNRDHHFYMDLNWKNKLVPYIVMFVVYLRCIGFGMAAKYFQLFFISEFQFTPIFMTFVLTLQGLVFGIMLLCFSRVSHTLGTPFVSYMCTLITTTSFILMLQIESKFWVVFFFLTRGGAYSCLNTFDQVTLMKYSDPRHKGKWSTVRSMTIGFLQLSSFCGGFVSDIHGYRFNFHLSTLFFVLTTLSSIPILMFVHNEDKPNIRFRMPRIPFIRNN